MKILLLLALCATFTWAQIVEDDLSLPDKSQGDDNKKHQLKVEPEMGYLAEIRQGAKGGALKLASRPGENVDDDDKSGQRPGENGGGIPPLLGANDVDGSSGPRPGENGGGLAPPSRPGENGGGLPHLLGANGRGLPPAYLTDGDDVDGSSGPRPGEGEDSLPPEYLIHGDGRGLQMKELPGDEDGAGLPHSRPGENGAGLPPSRPGENGGGLPPRFGGPDVTFGGVVPHIRPGQNGGGLPPIHLRPGNKICIEKRDSGPCRALIPRYYYDAETNSCKEFGYGGCLGNANNFVSADECQRSCVVQQDLKEDPSHHHGGKPCWKNQKRCQGPAVTGPCRASIPRFYYDAGSNACRPFVYGGCGRNDNHWIHQKNCESVCLRKTIPSKCRNEGGDIFYLPPRRRHCPALKCSQHCRHGYKRDRNGCATCECLKHCKHRKHHKHGKHAHHDSNDGRHLSLELDFE